MNLRDTDIWTTAGTEERRDPKSGSRSQAGSSPRRVRPRRPRGGEEAVCPAPARIFRGQCGSRCSCQAWQEPGSRPASAWECGRAPPLPAGLNEGQAPRAADVSLATAPSRHPAPCRLFHAGPWGPEMCGGMNGALQKAAGGCTGDVGVGSRETWEKQSCFGAWRDPALRQAPASQRPGFPFKPAAHRGPTLSGPRGQRGGRVQRG